MFQANTTPFNAGRELAIAVAGVNFRSFKHADAVREEIDGTEAFQKLACHLGANVYRAAGRGDAYGCMLLDRISEAPWNEEFRPMSDAVLSAFAKVAAEQKAGSAGWMAPLRRVAGAAAANAPNSALALAALGAIGGGSIGSLAWLLNRHSLGDTAEAESLKRRAQIYERLSAQIDEEMRAKSPREDVNALAI